MDSGILLYLLVGLSSLLASVRGEVFTALVEMEKPLRSEAEVAKELDTYISAEEDRLSKLKSIAADMTRHSKEALENPTRYLGNPVNAFLTVKRFAVDWKNHIKTLFTRKNDETFLNSVQQHTESFPGEEDFSGAAVALLRLQDTYKLEPHNLARGIIPGVVNSETLSAADCFEMGRIAYNEGDQHHTLEWMQEALVRLAEEGEDPTIEEPMILDYLSYAAYAEGNVFLAKNATLKMLLMVPGHSRAQRNLQFFNDKIVEQERSKQRGDAGEVLNSPQKDRSTSHKRTDEFDTYEALCRGENTHKIKDEHRLTCQYRFWHPMFYIKPLKEETMSFKPWLAVYHDIITDSEIEKIKALATPKLNRATVHNPATGRLEYAKYRISKSGWLKDEHDPLVARISARCSALTNLTLDTVEELQVVNYGIGGHYEPHLDFARPEEATAFGDFRGNRILTVIFYLSEVPAGGVTAFVRAGLKVYPKKGSAAVWYNLLPSGVGDFTTRHAGCPVLAGSKWVANKWFHERGQEFARRCGLQPNSSDIFVNQ